LRVAAHNRAAFEWIHHEAVARDAGLTTAQLCLIRDTSTQPSRPSSFPFTPLQAATLIFTDSSTKEIIVSDAIFCALRDELRALVDGTEAPSKDSEDQVQDMLVEAAAVVATYNMVSRFLVSLDVAGMSDDPVPWPADRREVRLSNT
jgi:alkylhydroperoxidase family enzyme